MSVKKSFSVPPWRRSSPWITRWSGWRARDWAFLERALHGNPLDGHTLDKARDGDRINALLAAVGYNFHLRLRWMPALLYAVIQIILGQAGNEKPT